MTLNVNGVNIYKFNETRVTMRVNKHSYENCIKFIKHGLMIIK
jgi:hypothetical protein